MRNDSLLDDSLLRDSMLDEDEQALLKKPRPIGWFIAGVVTIAAGAFVAGYYMPLSQAHSKLLKKHQGLAQKADELDHSLKKDRSSLAATDTRRAALQKFIDGGAKVEKEASARVEMMAATAQTQLTAFTKAKLLEIEVEPSSLRLSFQDKALFRPRSSVPSGSAKSTLCKAVGGLAAEKDWGLTVVTRAPAGDKKYWETVGKRGAALAKILEERCDVPSHQIRVRTERPVAEGEEDNAGVTEIFLGPQNEARFSASAAPPEKAEGG
jgi:hypothetical protein